MLTDARTGPWYELVLVASTANLNDVEGVVVASNVSDSPIRPTGSDAGLVFPLDIGAATLMTFALPDPRGASFAVCASMPPLGSPVPITYPLSISTSSWLRPLARFFVSVAEGMASSRGITLAAIGEELHGEVDTTLDAMDADRLLAIPDVVITAPGSIVRLSGVSHIGLRHGLVAFGRDLGALSG